ncbi:MAG: hypothetical protein A2Y15_04790 [Clostridiales bacterium GWF2_36_10]|nr:MAG: hypothetical protein A2Y15_04790 [Clostridiales bacterium GWF2_36_10]HAN20849.1 hypothetical protein [Clostridiales bacterium]
MITLEIIFPMLIVVLMIFGAYYATKWIAKKQNSFSSGKIIKVIERVMLSKDAFIAIVKVDTKIYLMSISSGKTELLTELPPEIIDNYKTTGPSTDFMSILKSFMNKHDDVPKGRDKKDE